MDLFPFSPPFFILDMDSSSVGNIKIYWGHKCKEIFAIHEINNIYLPRPDPVADLVEIEVRFGQTAISSSSLLIQVCAPHSLLSQTPISVHVIKSNQICLSQ